MKHKSATEENNPSQTTVDGPGSQLRKARERKGLEQAKVAAQLHLSQSMIQALEWDDYEKLPAAVFVQGYLRNYARLLGVDEEAVISAYQELQPSQEQSPLPRNQPDQVARDLHSDHRLIHYVTWGVVLVLGVLAFFWWQGRMEAPETAVSGDAGRELVEPGFPSRDLIDTGPMNGERLPGLNEPEATASEPPEVMAEPPSVIEAPLEENLMTPPQESAASAVVEEAPVEPEPPVSETALPETTLIEPPASEPSVPEPDMSEAGESQVLPASPPAASTASAGLLVFEFTGPCWVEVRDATGRARIIGEMREGSRRSLDAASGPFSLVIGDIHAVNLSVNGEAYDLGQHTRGKVARFTLDPSRL